MRASSLSLLLQGRRADPEGLTAVIRAGVRTPPGSRSGSRVRQAVLSRALYRVRGFDLSAVSMRDKSAALRHLVAAWAPFEQGVYVVGVQGSWATVMGWDAQEIAALVAGNEQLAGATLVPEGLLRRPGSPGVRLVPCLEGFEGQLWGAAGCLLHSSWWAGLPGEQEWQAFLRHREAAKWPGVSATPSEDVPWLARPWLKVSPLEQWEDRHLGVLRAATPVLVAALGVVIGLQGREYIEASQRLAAAQRDRQALEERAQPWSAARAEAQRLAEQSNRLATALAGPSPIDLMAELAQNLPAKGALLRELALDGRNMSLALEVAPDVARSELVSNLQTNGYFAEVREVSRTQPAGLLGFTMTVKGRP